MILAFIGLIALGMLVMVGADSLMLGDNLTAIADIKAAVSIAYKMVFVTWGVVLANLMKEVWQV